MNKIFQDSSRHLFGQNTILSGEKTNITWRILSDLPIAYGGVSVIYEAKSDDGQVAAIKVFSPSSRFEMAKANVYDRFMAEIEIYKNLGNNPHVLKYYDSGLYHNSPWIALELCSTNTLKDYIENSIFDLKKAYFIFRLILQGVQYLHKNNVIHRDLKPNNIFFSNESIKIGDLGASKILFDNDFEMTLHNDQLGSLLYISPHQMKDPSKADVFDDYYSLGLILYELINKQRLPHGEEPKSHLVRVLINAYQKEFRLSKFRSNCLKDIQLCLDAEDPNLPPYDGVVAFGKHYARKYNNIFIEKISKQITVWGYEYLEAKPEGLGLIYSVLEDKVILFKREADLGDWDLWHKDHYKWTLNPAKNGLPLAIERDRVSDK